MQLLRLPRKSYTWHDAIILWVGCWLTVVLVVSLVASFSAFPLPPLCEAWTVASKVQPSRCQRKLLPVAIRRPLWRFSALQGEDPQRREQPNQSPGMPSDADLPVAASGKSSNPFLVADHPMPTGVMDVAASITQESCPLLGVKSLGVDYGLVRTGLAVTVGYEPIPLAILQAPTEISSANATTYLCARIMEYAVSQQVHRLIVGLPLHKNGTVAEQTNLTLAFGAQLAATALRTLGPRVPVLFFDERYTSQEAEARAHSRNPQQRRDRRQFYGTLDADAAAIILENYYQDGGVGARALELPADVRDECLEQFECQQQEREQVRRRVVEERQARIQQRKEAVATAEEEWKVRNDSDVVAESSDRKSKKKKKKRKK